MTVETRVIQMKYTHSSTHSRVQARILLLLAGCIRVYTQQYTLSDGVGVGYNVSPKAHTDVTASVQ